MVTIGIDVGGSTTKIVGFSDKEKMFAPISVGANDPVTSIYGALGRFTSENAVSLNDIGKIKITGVGGSFIGSELYNCPCVHVDEFECFGSGGLYLTGLDRAIAVSMGTGTAIAYANADGVTEYLGGTGVGGGTLIGLARRTIGLENFDIISELALEGDLSKVDLRIGDLYNPDRNFSLPETMTASNFGKLSELATKEDIALGLLNMVYESVGMLAVFAARGKGLRDIVLTGHLATFPQAKAVFTTLNEMMNVNFIIPENPQFATAIGAALHA